MKYNLLKETEPILILDGYQTKDKTKTTLMETLIYTDAHNIKRVQYDSQKIEEYSINNNYYPNINTLIKTDIWLEESTYLVTVLLIKENDIYTIKNIEVYLKDAKDKSSIKEVRDILDMVYSQYPKNKPSKDKYPNKRKVLSQKNK
jgi:hypothetical protein